LATRLLNNDERWQKAD